MIQICRATQPSQTARNKINMVTVGIPPVEDVHSRTPLGLLPKAPFQSRKLLSWIWDAVATINITPLPYHQSRKGYCAVLIMHHVRMPAPVREHIAYRGGSEPCKRNVQGGPINSRQSNQFHRGVFYFSGFFSRRFVSLSFTSIKQHMFGGCHTNIKPAESKQRSHHAAAHPHLPTKKEINIIPDEGRVEVSVHVILTSQDTRSKVEI